MTPGEQDEPLLPKATGSSRRCLSLCAWNGA